MASESVRKRRTEQDWRRFVAQQAGSGLPVAAWCRQQGLVAATFHWWRRELARRDAQRAKAAFVAVQVQPDEPVQPQGRIEIVLAGERRVRLCGPVDRRQLTEVLAVLEALAC
jgi:transposase-like protein